MSNQASSKGNAPLWASNGLLWSGLKTNAALAQGFTGFLNVMNLIMHPLKQFLVLVIATAYFELGHDVEVISYDKLDSVSHTVYLSIVHSTSHFHRVYVDGYNCVWMYECMSKGIHY